METQIVNVPLGEIIYNQFQVAGTINQTKVDEIKSSLQHNRENGAKGLLQLTRARQIADGRYEQAFGRHRLIAFQQLSNEDSFWSEMPLLVSEMTDIEMFELMGIENFHRRDISPIEEASIFSTYQVKFKMTSAATAQKFGKTEEYVRGAIRLLNLPESARELVGNGSLNKSTGRDLLVLEKIGGAELVEKAIENIKEDEFADTQDSIMGALRNDPNVVFLHIDNDWSKAKKFPVKHLAPITTAMLKEILPDADKDVLKEIERYIAGGMEVTGEAFPQFDNLERIRILANPPQCEICPLHAVMDGSHYCGSKLCSERKKAAWEKNIAEVTSKKTGIPLYQKSDGLWEELTSYRAEDDKLIKSGSADLRLMPTRYSYHNPEGIPSTLKVVVVGEALAKRKNKEATVILEGKKVEVSREIQRKVSDAQDESFNRFLWEVASREFASVLDGVTSLEYLKYAYTDVDSFDHDGQFPASVEDEDTLYETVIKLKKADALKELRRMTMFHAIFSELPGSQFEGKNPLVRLAEDCKDLAALWEVKLPKDFVAQAEKYQAELDAEIKEIKKAAKS